MSDGFTYLVYRVEWHVMVCGLSANGEPGYTFETSLAAFPTKDAAEVFRANNARRHSHLKDEWVPQYGNGYERVYVVRKEVKMS